MVETYLQDYAGAGTSISKILDRGQKVGLFRVRCSVLQCLLNQNRF